jgi:hypothetical protein
VSGEAPDQPVVPRMDSGEPAPDAWLLFNSSGRLASYVRRHSGDDDRDAVQEAVANDLRLVPVRLGAFCMACGRVLLDGPEPVLEVIGSGLHVVVSKPWQPSSCASCGHVPRAQDHDNDDDTKGGPHGRG